MPLFYQQVIDADTRLAIWHITEDEAFFLKKVPVKKEVHHAHKRLQHLAGRYLLTCLFDDFPLHEILIADTRKPYLDNEQYHFSISHCGDFAAAIASRSRRVGVDVEIVSPKLAAIQPKYVSSQEWELSTLGWKAIHAPSREIHPENDHTLLKWDLLRTILWSAKESVFKWHSTGNIDFKQHMQVAGPIVDHNGEQFSVPFLFQKNTPVLLTVNARVFDNLVLSFVAQ